MGTKLYTRTADKKGRASRTYWKAFDTRIAAEEWLDEYFAAMSPEKAARHFARLGDKKFPGLILVEVFMVGAWPTNRNGSIGRW